MANWVRFWGGLLVGLAALTAGCGEQPAPPPASAKAAAAAAEAQVREAFARLQTAIKARDAAKVWALLDKPSREEAERAAQETRTAYDKAAPQERTRQAQKLGVSEDELAKLSGRGSLKTHIFWDKFGEFEEGVVDRVSVDSTGASVYLHMPDGDKEKLAFVQEDGVWKVGLKMPKVK
jgi:hypothetical protein